jgi:hypothetical protein
MISKNLQISDFKEIRLVEAKLFHVDRQTGEQKNDATNRFLEYRTCA